MKSDTYRKHSLTETPSMAVSSAALVLVVLAFFCKTTLSEDRAVGQSGQGSRQFRPGAFPPRMQTQQQRQQQQPNLETDPYFFGLNDIWASEPSRSKPPKLGSGYGSGFGQSPTPKPSKPVVPNPYAGGAFDNWMNQQMNGKPKPRTPPPTVPKPSSSNSDLLIEFGDEPVEPLIPQQNKYGFGTGQVQYGAYNRGFGSPAPSSYNRGYGFGTPSQGQSPSYYAGFGNAASAGSGRDYGFWVAQGQKVGYTWGLGSPPPSSYHRGYGFGSPNRPAQTYGTGFSRSPTPASNRGYGGFEPQSQSGNYRGWQSGPNGPFFGSQNEYGYGFGGQPSQSGSYGASQYNGGFGRMVTAMPSRGYYGFGSIHQTHSGTYNGFQSSSTVHYFGFGNEYGYGFGSQHVQSHGRYPGTSAEYGYGFGIPQSQSGQYGAGPYSGGFGSSGSGYSGFGSPSTSQAGTHRYQLGPNGPSFTTPEDYGKWLVSQRSQSGSYGSSGAYNGGFGSSGPQNEYGYGFGGQRGQSGSYGSGPYSGGFDRMVTAMPNRGGYNGFGSNLWESATYSNGFGTAGVYYGFGPGQGPSGSYNGGFGGPAYGFGSSGVYSGFY